MRRRQLVEIEDLAWCPRAIRDGGTDWLGFMANGTGVYNPVAVKLREAMNATGTTHVLDLCSGGGGPWLTLERELAKSGPVTVTLSDLYPNGSAFDDVRARSEGRIAVEPRSIDATDVPARLTGVRTMFASFHHFAPKTAAAILADAVRQRRAIAIFEAINSRAVGLAAMPLQLPAILLLTPFVKPFKWSRLLLTYLPPLIPMLVLFDGTVSMLRLYLEDDLRDLLTHVPGHETFTWEIGSTPLLGPFGIMHLVGTPKSSYETPSSSMSNTSVEFAGMLPTAVDP